MTDKVVFNLENQRLALQLLPDVVSYSGLTLDPNYIQEFLTASGLYTLLPSQSPQRFDLLLHLSQLFDKVIDELTQLYMAGPAVSLLQRNWPHAEQYKSASKQNKDLTFLYALISDFYQALASNNSGLPIPYEPVPA